MKLKPFVKPLAFLSLILIILSLATPYVTKSQLKKWMLDNGAETARIEHLYLNIWSGRLIMQGLSANADNTAELKIGHLEADVSYRALWKQHLQLNYLQLFDSTLPLQQQGQQWKIGPLHIPAGGSEPASETPSNWNWGLTQLQLKALKIDANLDQQQHQLIIDDSQLQLLHNWQPDHHSLLSFQGSLNGSAFNIDSKGTPLSEHAAGELTLKLDKLILESLLKPWLPDLKGILSSDLNLTISQTNSGLKVSQKGMLKLQQFSYQQADLSIQSPTIQWQGSSTAELSGNQVQALTSNGQLTARSPAIVQEQLNLDSEQISWQGKNNISFLQNQPSTLLSEGTLAMDKLKMAQKPLALQGGDINWQGKNQLKFNQGIPESIETKGQLALSDINIEQAQLQLSSKSLNWDGNNQLHLTNNGIQRLANNGKLDITAFSLTQPAASLNESEIHWSGTLDTDLVKQLQIKGVFSTALSKMGIGPLALSSSSRHWQGGASFDLERSQLQTLSGALTVNSILLSGNDNIELARVDSMQLKDLAALPDNHLAAEEIRFKAIKLSNQQPLLDLAAVEINNVQLGATSASIGALNIGVLETELALNKEGQPQAWLDWQQALTGKQPQQQSQQQTPVANNSDRTPFHFKLKQLQLSSPATIRFSDESVNARDIEITINKLELANIDTQSSDPGPFKLASKINRFGQLDLAGNYSWMSPTPNGDWQGKLNTLELPPFSPYMQRYSGYQLKSGQFNIGSKGTVKAGMVESQSEVSIQNLNVSQAKEAETGEFDQKLGMPLETAISILTDDDNNLTLNIPITGAVDDPKFGYQSVINIIMAKAAKEGAISYLTTALQPYGALISLGRLVASSASKNAIDLEPVTFLPGSSELSPKALDYLTKIAELMKKREALRLNLCGIAVAADGQSFVQARKEKRLAASQAAASTAAPSAPVIMEIPAKELAAMLNTLAQERSENVKKVLLEVGGTKAERLFSCLPEIKLKADIPPQVSLGL